jgi:hypothetical protein
MSLLVLLCVFVPWWFYFASAVDRGERAMTALNTTCPPESMLSDFGLGKLDAANAETISKHIETCADCRRRVAGVSGDSFVGRLREAGGAAPPAARRERTFVPGESLANAANSTDGAEDGLPRPSRSIAGEKPRDGLGSPSSVSAPPELMNHPDYELIKELGQGGMGTVYPAQNRMMDRPEVLKVISKALLDRPGALERFQQEIRSAAKLAHPNIVAAYSVLRPGDLLVFAMEYVVEFKKMAGNGLFALGIGHGSANESFFYRLGLFANARHDVGYDRAGKHFNLGFRKASLDQGRWYGALVRVRGNRCECFLDGENLFAFTADGAIKGPMSLSSKNALYRFRNIVIKAPDGAVLLEGLPDLEHSLGAKHQLGAEAFLCAVVSYPQRE